MRVHSDVLGPRFGSFLSTLRVILAVLGSPAAAIAVEAAAAAVEAAALAVAAAAGGTPG